MVVTMLQLIFEVPESSSLKDKRRIVKSIKDRMRLKYHVSCAEVDLHDSLRFAQIGAAIVSNSATFGESVMNKALATIENDFSLRIHDSSVASEQY